MLFKSPLITKGSGSLGGMTFSRNRGGNYIRERALPTNPNSTLQQAVRAALASLSIHWQDTLTLGQRMAWDTYAENVSVTNRIGETIYLTGLNHYIRSNVGRIQAAEPRVDNAPVIFNLGTFTAPSFAIDTANDEIDITIDNTDEWANEDDAAMLIYVSQAKDPTINFFKGPYRFADGIEGDSITPPTSPASFTLGYVVTAGQRVFARAVVSRADGRLSSDFRGQADAA